MAKYVFTKTIDSARIIVYNYTSLFYKEIFE